MTTTTNKGYTLPVVGGDSGTWGNELNTNFGIIDNNMGGTGTVNCAGNTDVNVSSSTARNLILQLTGAVTGNINVNLPSVGGFYVIINDTTGGFTINVQTISAALGIDAVGGTSILVYCDGTNVISPQATVPQNTWSTVGYYYPSGASSLAIPLDAQYVRYRLICQQMFVSTSATLSLQLSADGGSTFVTTGYNYIQDYSIGSSATAAGSNSTSFSGLLISPTLSASKTWDSVTNINPGDTGIEPRALTTGYGYASTNFYIVATIGAGWAGTTTRYNYMQLVSSAGTFSGNVLLEALGF